MPAEWGWKFAQQAVAKPSIKITDVWEDRNGLKISRFGDTERGRFRLTFDAGLAFDILTDRKLIVSQSGTETPADTIDHLVADQILPRAISHGGTLVVHAAAVEVCSGAIALLGDTGSGKSTLSAFLSESSARLLGDDASIFFPTETCAIIRAVQRSLRLFPDSIGALFKEPPETRSMAHYSAKRHVRLSLEAGFHDIRLCALFVLDRYGQNQAITLQRLTPAEACLAIIRNSFALDPSDTQRANQRMTKAARVASVVPAFSITYPRDYACLPAVRKAILDQVETLGAE